MATNVNDGEVKSIHADLLHFDFSSFMIQHLN